MLNKICLALLTVCCSATLLMSLENTPWLYPEFEGAASFRIDQGRDTPIGTIEGAYSVSETLETAILARSSPQSISWRLEKQLSNDLQGEAAASSLFSSLGNALPWNIGFDHYPLATAAVGFRMGTHIWIHQDSYEQVFGSAGALINKKEGTEFFQLGTRYVFKKRHSLHADVWALNRIEKVFLSFLYSYDLDNGSTISVGMYVRRTQRQNTTQFCTLSYSIPL